MTTSVKQEFEMQEIDSEVYREGIYNTIQDLGNMEEGYLTVGTSERSRRQGMNASDMSRQKGRERSQTRAMIYVSLVLIFAGLIGLAAYTLTKLQKLPQFAYQKTTLVAVDCQDYWLAGYRLSGVYEMIIPTNTGRDMRVMAYCDLDVVDDRGGWLVLMRRQNGETSFGRSWDEYKEGFGDNVKEYWIGNEVMHQLTSNSDRDYEIRFDIMTSDNRTLYAKHLYFAISDEKSKYSLTISGRYSGTAGNSMSHHYGLPFSTFDHDNDQHEGSCADSHNGGWWYRDCHYIVLTGACVGKTSSMLWYDKGDLIDLKYADMKIKPSGSN